MPRVDQFELVSELARGAMGVVFRAFDTELRREVALKILPADAWLTEDLVRFRHEAESMARVRHPNLVAVHSAGTTNGRPYIVMDLVQGESLASRLERDQRPPPGECAQLILRLARGLAAAHAQGVIHRDVKPANVVIDAHGQPVLIDFGLARDVGRGTRLTQEGDLLGTPAYMAPEQAAGRNERVGPGTDVYALGAMLHHLLSGKPPFMGRGVMDTVELILRARPPELGSRVDPELETITRRCLEKDPARRYPDARALADALESWLAGEVPAAPPRRPTARALPVGWVIGGLCALLLVLALALMLSGPTLPETPTAPARPAPPTPSPQRPAPITPSPGPAAPDPVPAPRPPLGPLPSDADMWGVYESRDYERLDELAGRRLAADPEDEPALLARGRARLELKRRDEALEALERLVQLHPNSSAGYELLCRLHRERGDLQRARQAIDTCLRLGPTSDRVRMLADLQVVSGDLAGAQDTLDRWRSQMEDRDERSLVARLEALEAALQQARRALARADEQLSRPVGARLAADQLDALVHELERAGSALEAVGEGSLQETLGATLVELAPGRDDGYELRGRARLRLGRVEEALADAQRLIELEPHDPDGYLIRAHAALEQGRQEDALRDMEAASERIQHLKPAKAAELQSALSGLRRRLEKQRPHNR